MWLYKLCTGSKCSKEAKSFTTDWTSVQCSFSNGPATLHRQPRVVYIPKGSLMLPCRPHFVLSSTGLNHRISSEEKYTYTSSNYNTVRTNLLQECLKSEVDNLHVRVFRYTLFLPPTKVIFLILIRFLGCIECMRCWLLLPMFTVFVGLSVTRIKSAAAHWVIQCSLWQITLASCYNCDCEFKPGSWHSIFA